MSRYLLCMIGDHRSLIIWLIVLLEISSCGSSHNIRKPMESVMPKTIHDQMKRIESDVLFNFRKKRPPIVRTLSKITKQKPTIKIPFANEERKTMSHEWWTCLAFNLSHSNTKYIYHANKESHLNTWLKMPHSVRTATPHHIDSHIHQLYIKKLRKVHH